MSYKILVVDDSPFIRRLLIDWIKTDPSFEVVGTASNGNEAVALAKSLSPHVITLDIEMPHRDGLSALQEIMTVCPTAVLMVSSLTTEGAQATIKALELGAVDFVTKPSGSSSLAFTGSKESFLERLRACVGAKVQAPKRQAVVAKSFSGTTDRVVLMASSTGGPKALSSVWESLPKGFPAPILMVQHMPAAFTESLARRLDGIGTVPVKEAVDGEQVKPGQAYMAQGGLHMVVEEGGILRYQDTPPLHGVKPAADHLFQTAASIYGKRALGVILTGMGKDGAAGAVTLIQCGATVFGEDESTCTVYGMPKAAKDAGGLTAQFPLHEMGAAIVAALKERVARAS